MFLLLKGEAESRIDPNFYKVEFQNLLKKIKRNKYKKLGEVVEFSSESWNQIDFFDDYFPYIEISEIDIISGEIKNISLTSKNDAASRAKMIVREDDIIVSSTRPSRGAIAKIDKISDFSIASTGFTVLRKLKTNQLSREFLFFILRQKLCLIQMEQRSSGGNYPAITQEELSNILIPILQEKVEQNIINIFEKAYDTKKEKEAQAKALLASIDEFLLKELGITLPDKQENSLKNRVFLRNISEVSGGRLDAFYYKDEFEELRNLLSKCKDIIRLGSIIDVITKGETPSGEGSNYISDGIPFLRVQNISIEGIKKDLMFISKEVHNKMNRSKLFGGEILFTIAGSVGVVTLFPDNFGESNINQAIAKITLKKYLSVNKNYVIEILNSSVCKQQIKKFLTVSAQPNINFDQIKSIEILLPPLEIQEKIVNHIQSIRDKARALETEAKEILEQAKAEVERIILGE